MEYEMEKSGFAIEHLPIAPVLSLKNQLEEATKKLSKRISKWVSLGQIMLIAPMIASAYMAESHNSLNWALIVIALGGLIPISIMLEDEWIKKLISNKGSWLYTRFRGSDINKILSLESLLNQQTTELCQQLKDKNVQYRILNFLTEQGPKVWHTIKYSYNHKLDQLTQSFIDRDYLKASSYIMELMEMATHKTFANKTKNYLEEIKPSAATLQDRL